MQTAQTDLTILGANTPEPAVFWKGQPVPAIKALSVAKGVVTLTLPEDPLLAEMIASGIKIVRVGA